MKSALVIGHGQIGTEIATQLSAAGIRTRIASRTAPHPPALTTATRGSLISSGSESASLLPTTRTGIESIQADATDRTQLLAAAEGVDAIFACAHAPYDSRQWATILPRMDATILDVAEELNIPVVFPESVYAFARLSGPITESSPFAPADAKGRIRQGLIEARAAHGARAISVAAGDLIGRTAAPDTSVIKMCITDPIQAGRRALVPARVNVQHGITVISDLARAMIHAATLDFTQAEAHRLLLAPATNPTPAEIARYTYEQVGSPAKRAISLPWLSTRLAGVFNRSMFELSELKPLWYEPSIIEPGAFAATIGTTTWQAGVNEMLA